MIITNSRYALVGYFITSYPTLAHGIIVIRALTLVSHDFFENGFCATTQPLIKHACYLCLGLFLSPQNIKKNTLKVNSCHLFRSGKSVSLIIDKETRSR